MSLYSQMQKNSGTDSQDLKDLYIKIGKNVKYYRELNNLTQLDLALKLNYKSSSIISNPEIFYKEKYKFSIKQLFEISAILDVPMQNFFE